MTRWVSVFLGFLVYQSQTGFSSDADDLRAAIRKSIKSTTDIDREYDVQRPPEEDEPEPSRQQKLQKLQGTFARVFFATKKPSGESSQSKDHPPEFAIRQLSQAFNRPEAHLLLDVKNDIDSHLTLLARPNFKHPNFVQIIDVVLWESIPTVIQSRAPGEDLYTVLYGEDGKSLPELSSRQATVIIKQLLTGIGWLNDDQELCHRDLKHENVIIDRQARSAGRSAWQVRICDFGSLVTMPATRDGQTSYAAMASWHTTPPECFCFVEGRLQPTVKVSGKEDVWAIALIAVDLLALPLRIGHWLTLNGQWYFMPPNGSDPIEYRPNHPKRDLMRKLPDIADSIARQPHRLVYTILKDPNVRHLVDKIITRILVQKTAHNRPSARDIEGAFMTEEQLKKLGINSDLTLAGADDLAALIGVIKSTHKI